MTEAEKFMDEELMFYLRNAVAYSGCLRGRGGK